MSDDRKYVTRLMRARCDKGSMDNYLNVDKDHGILVGADMQPLMNANDHTNKHVIHFGNCESDQNPERMFRRKLVGGMLCGIYAPLLGDVVGDFLEDVGIMTCKCKPNTPNPWCCPNENNVVDGAPALTVGSKLTCRYGGVITIVDPDDEVMFIDDITAVDNKISEYETRIMEEYGQQIADYLAAKSDAEQEIALQKIDIMPILQEMADEIVQMNAVQKNHNDLFNFVKLVNTGCPLDLKNRRYTDAQWEDLHIWRLPFIESNAETMRPDYMGNWLYGYVGSEYFTTPLLDDVILKCGAGLAQLLSDGKNGDKSSALLKYIKNIINGNYGDNDGDADMIQEGIDAYREKHEN